MWSECIGVVSGHCYKEVYLHNHFYFPYSTSNSSFSGSSIPNFVFIFELFFVYYYLKYHRRVLQLISNRMSI